MKRRHYGNDYDEPPEVSEMREYGVLTRAEFLQAKRNERELEEEREKLNGSKTKK
jgi:hypothetical protein